jgi:hypothetical protein
MPSSSEMDRSWKDEYLLAILCFPLPLAFLGATGASWVAGGFDALAHMPAWYVGALMAGTAASFGARNVLQRFTLRP